MRILIQYEGFVVSPSSRTYNFHVIDTPGESRQFTVQVPSESFRLTPLRFQDGPPISFERLQLEIDGETQGLHAQADLNISGTDILEYLDRQHPRKLRKKELAAQLLAGRSSAESVSFRCGLRQNGEDSGMKKAGPAIAEAVKLERQDSSWNGFSKL